MSCSAYTLTDTEQILTGMLSKGDIIAQEAKYHTTCLVDLYRGVDQFQLGSRYSDDKKQKHSLTFPSVTPFIEDSIDFGVSEEKQAIFELSKLIKAVHQTSARVKCRSND